MELGVLTNATVAICVWDEGGRMHLFGTADPRQLIRAAASSMGADLVECVTSDQVRPDITCVTSIRSRIRDALSKKHCLRKR